MTLRAGDTVQDFVVEELIGSGGMGAVYRARDTKLDRTVALKILTLDPVEEDDGTRARFEREAGAIGDVSHPAVARVFSADVHCEKPWIAMQFIDGVPLDVRLAADGRLPPAEVLALLRPIAEALDELHSGHGPQNRSGPTIHRDIKPANIVLPRSPSHGPPAILVDFGIARRSDGSDQLTATNVVTGTPGYVAPEGCGPDGDQRGTAADQYSLAVVAYEALTGERPFPPGCLSPNVHGRMHAELMGTQGRGLDLPAPTFRALMRALDTAPEKRFSNCVEFMERMQEGYPSRSDAGELWTSDYPEYRPHEPQKSSRRTPKRTLWVIGVLAAVVGLAAVGVRMLPDDVGVTMFRAVTDRDLPPILHSNFPGLVPESTSEDGYEDTICEEEQAGFGVTAAVVCGKVDLSYAVAHYTSADQREERLSADPQFGRFTESVQDGQCEVTATYLQDPGEGAPFVLAIEPLGASGYPLIVAGLEVDSIDGVHEWISRAPLCSER